MVRRFLLRRVQRLDAPGQPWRSSDVLIEDGRLLELEASASGPERDTKVVDAEGCWLAPPLVDPHSVLEDPFDGHAETLRSLAAAARAGGYGHVTLLPWATPWRDRPERLMLRGEAAEAGAEAETDAVVEPLRFGLWGSFSADGADQELADHAAQLAAGALGLAAGEALPPLTLLERGLRLAEMGERPVLLAPRELSLTQQGFVRECVEALRAGWPLDPPISETLPLESLLALAGALPQATLRLMNLSTAEAVRRLRSWVAAQPEDPALQASTPQILASVCWWHLVADSGRLDPADEGWRLVPSLGGPQDREALIAALADGLIVAVGVHHQALDAEEQLLPLDQRRPGLAGHGLVLPMLWQELVEGRGWTPAQLWQALCWGPGRFLGLEPEVLAPGSRRWILFDPGRPWPEAGPGAAAGCGSRAANRPGPLGAARGVVVASGLSEPQSWSLPGGPLR
jgi:dihydroorotase